LPARDSFVLQDLAGDDPEDAKELDRPYSGQLIPNGGNTRVNTPAAAGPSSGMMDSIPSLTPGFPPW
jgi:hypothetical protein